MKESWGSPPSLQPHFCVDQHGSLRFIAGVAHSRVCYVAIPDTCTYGTCLFPTIPHPFCASLGTWLSKDAVFSLLPELLLKDLSKAKARTGGPMRSLFLLLSSPDSEPCPAAAPQTSGERPQGRDAHSRALAAERAGPGG